MERKSNAELALDRLPTPLRHQPLLPTPRTAAPAVAVGSLLHERQCDVAALLASATLAKAHPCATLAESRRVLC